MVGWIIALALKMANRHLGLPTTQNSNKKKVSQMAGRIENGDPTPQEEEEWLGPDAALGEPLTIETEAFCATALPMHSMPGEGVLAVIEADGQKQIIKMYELFKLAITDPKKASNLEGLSFSELTEVVAQWVEKSSMAGGDD